MAVTALLRLGTLLGRTNYLDVAYTTLQAAAPLMQQMPMGTGQMLLALDMQLNPMPQLLFVGKQASQAAAEVHRRFIPRRVIAARDVETERQSILDPVYENRASESETATLYVCADGTCQAPLASDEAIKEMIAKL